MRKKLILVLAAGFLFTGCTPKPASPAAVPDRKCGSGASGWNEADRRNDQRDVQAAERG